MREFGTDRELPGTEEAARTNLAVPMSPVLGPEQAAEVVAAAGALAPA
jgi:dTDP-4-amino-4,6-dideoxygalactose transaminase